MQRRNGITLLSASDLVAFLACEHSTTLSLRHLDEPLPKAQDDASARLIAEKGMAHERGVLAAFEADGLTVVKLAEHDDVDDLVEQTHAALRSGADIIYQGTLVTSPLFGRTDFLRRVPRPSHLGDWSYEVVDTKLARTPKAKFAVQLAFYSDLLRDAQGTMPEAMHVKLGDGREVSLRVADYDRYVADARDRLLAFTRTRPATVAERSEACGLCPWRDVCNEHWKRVDHLNQIAGISRTQTQRLATAGIATVETLASVDAEAAKVPRMTAATLAKLAGQARLQAERRRTGVPRHELLPLDPDQRRGFYRLPKPNTGDLFFDMEGDPLEPGGLEYLFGVYHIDTGEPRFTSFWAHDRSEERVAFERFIDFVVERVEQDPDLHIYHYGHYEESALKRLMTSHGTREAQLDVLLRSEKLVDLYQVVREAMRTSESGLSIKDLEIFYMPPREGEIKDAGASIVHYEAWKQTGDDMELALIRDYNEMDCVSTQKLRDWLLGMRPAGLPWFEVTRAADAKEEEKALRAREIEAALLAYSMGLLRDVPADDQQRSPEDHARQLLFDLLDFHRRAAKPEWWAMFDRRDRTEDELIDDIECIGGLERTATPPVKEKSSHLYEYRYPEQETKFRAGKSCRRCDTADPLGSVHALDEARRLVTLKISPKNAVPDRCSIGPSGPIDTDLLRDAVRRLANAVIAGATQRYRAARAFLRRDAPLLRGFAPGHPVIDGSGELAAQALRAVMALDDSYLFIQGPPGAGKTTTGARLVVDLLKAGKRVGVTSNSHKVIHNLLHAVERQAIADGFALDGLKKTSASDPDSAFDGQFIGNASKTDEIVISSATLVAGTAWLFADLRFDGAFDYVFVDEAGQVSLANLMAVATATRNLVLLGDHMQLGQPIQGQHPRQSGQSALEYLLEGHATVAPDRGIFLPTSYRMHADVCRFISDAVYDARLAPDPANQRRQLQLDATAHPALRPSGIRFHGVPHEGCKQKSQEEADVLAAIVASLRNQRWTDKDGTNKPISLDDILVVAPYNAQVNLLRGLLPPGMRIGTIDKFQGQEAPVVLVSMTTSSGADLPRNIEFLYDKNRLNVAVSRAQCLAVVVASPALLHIHCNTPEQMALVNTLCWLKDYAEGLPRFPA